MIGKQQINEQLSKTSCHRCGSKLQNANLVPISEIPLALVGHVVCPKCQAESIVTITVAGSGSVPVTSDLTGKEIKSFIGLKSVSYDDLLDLHQMLRKESIWKLLQKKEKNLVKKQNSSGRKKSSQQ